VVNKLKKAGVIRRYHPLFGSSRATTIVYNLSRKNSVRRNSGLYRLGHGEKSVIWYWKFDMEKRYFHEFQTIDYRAAVEFYKANKFTPWQDGEGGQVDAQEERDDQKGDQEDDQAHGESKEQREADIDVRDQGHSEKVARHENGDIKDGDNRKEHVKSN